MTLTLPHPTQLRIVLNDLLGRRVDVKTIDAWHAGPADHACAAECVDDDQGLQAVLLVDLPLAIHMGASIGLVPAGAAKDMVGAAAASEAVLSNLYEALNVLTSVLNTEGNPHLRLGSMHAPDQPFPDPVNELVGRLTHRVDLAVDISGYGSGRLGLLAA